jgi:integrase/recombinase XerC
MALAYAQYLKQERERGHYSQIYCNDLYRSLRLFYEFAIREELATSPHRNPFALGDMPRPSDPLPRYLTDQEVRRILTYCEKDATPKERTFVITLFHTGVRAAELASLKASDIVQIQGKWKLHIHEGKGLKDRMIPLTPQCLATLQAWQAKGWEHIEDRLFTWYGRPVHGSTVSTIIRELGLKLGIQGLTPHRFRHTFAVTLLNYGMRESALQKVMGHTTLSMTLEYARILDQTVEQSFAVAVRNMQEGPTQWIPSFFTHEDYTLLAEGDTLNWIRLPLGYCRRNPQLHCEGDVKCLLCDRFAATPEDLPRFKAMCERFEYLGMPTKVEIVKEQIHQLEQRSDRLLSSSAPKDLTFFSI